MNGASLDEIKAKLGRILQDVRRAESEDEVRKLLEKAGFQMIIPQLNIIATLSSARSASLFTTKPNRLGIELRSGRPWLAF